MKKTISVIIPIFNEEKNINNLYQRLKKVFDSLSDNFLYEFILIDDGSNDNSVLEIEKLTAKDNSVKLIEFSRNFGKEIATTAGLNHAKGEAAIMIDADLQHPPEIIAEFIDKWQAGAEVVVGVRTDKKGESIIKKMCSKIFYKIMNLIGETKLVAGATDFRLIDRQVINEFNRFTEHNRITRGLVDWMGFRREYVQFQNNPREHGHASYSYLKLTRLAISSFVSHSLFPLKFAGYLGIVITICSGVMGLFVVIEDVILKDPLSLQISGTASLGILIIFLVGIILIGLGFIALYIGNIHAEVTNRPLYIIEKTRNLKISENSDLNSDISD